MEQKKLLWIAVIVGAFLLIITGTAFLLYGSNNKKTLTAESPKPSDTVWTPNSNLAISTGTPLVSENITDNKDIENTTEEKGINSTTIEKTNNADSLASNNTDISISNSLSNNSQKADNPETATNTEKTIVVDTIKVKNIEANTIDVRSITENSSKPVAKATTTKPAVKNQTQTSKVASSSTSTNSTKSASLNSTKQTDNKTINFWIQAGSLTDKLKAEETRQELSEKLITPEIFTREIDSVTYYRLRIGPYKSKQEANYWLAKVQSLKGFEGSYISQTVSN